jgi:hypothetical protein
MNGLQKLLTTIVSIVVTVMFTVASGYAQNGAQIVSFDTYGAFETAGITIELSNYDHDETARIFYKKAGTSTYHEGHPLIRYDANHMATSLFNLALNTTYDLRIELVDPDGTNPNQTVTTQVATRPEFSIPAALRTIYVSNSTGLQNAIAQIQPGDHILLQPGNYSQDISIYGKHGTANNPMVLAATDPNNKPHILNGIEIEQSSYLILDHLEIEDENGGNFGGVNIRGSHHTTITNCYIHDCSEQWVANIAILHGDEIPGSDKNGYHLIMNNIISEEDPWPPGSEDNPWDPYPGQTYFGIKMDYAPGGFTIIRGNTIYGVADAISPGGDEGQSPVLGLDDPNVLDTWGNQNLDIYDNIIYHVRDDCIETDGHLMNGRIFRNRLGECTNAISTAPVYPGPIFIVRNMMYGFKENVSKMNTGVPGETRNILWYHNTIKQATNTDYCIYRGEPGQTFQITFQNNIIMAVGRVIDTDMYTSGSYHRNHVFDYDLMYTTGSAPRFKWGDEPGSNKSYDTWEDFRNGTELDFGFRQERHGLYAEAQLDLTPIAGVPPGYGIVNGSLQAGSPGIDAALLMPGINDDYSGGGPDMGAFEYVGCFSPPAAAIPGEPSGTITDTTPTYTWNQVACATWYYLWVNNASGTPVIKQWYTAAQAGCASGTGACAVTPSTTLANGNHTWWIQTWNSYGYGPWSSGRSFTVSIPPPAVSLILPFGALGDPTPTYIWSAVSSATWYYLWVNGPSGNVLKQWYTSAQANCGGGACAVTPATTLTSGNHTWWVQTWNAAGYGPWSAGMSFTVSGCTPGKTVLIAPSGSVTNPPPYYWWYDVGNATWYYLWVNGPSGTPVIKQWYTAAQANCNGKWCWVTNSTTLPAGANTWWVQTWNACGYGSWSSGLSFTISTSGSQATGAVVTVRKQGTGTGTILVGEQVCGPECPELTLPYTDGAQFPLQVMPTADSRFVGWQTADGNVVEGAIFYAQPGDTVIAVFEKQN